MELWSNNLSFELASFKNLIQNMEIIKNFYI